MQGDQEETVHMLLEGVLADLLLKCDQKLFQLYLVEKNGKKVLYVKLVKSLCGTL